MKILVCIKQVPDSEGTLLINDSASWITYQKSTVFRMNRFDEFALEEAVLIAEHIPNTTVEALSVGPERVQTTIKKALEKGAHHGIHIHTQTESYISPLEVASFISSYAKDKDYDLILMGVMAEDDMQCQVGQLTSSLLDIPCASSVIYQEIVPDKNAVYVERELEEGKRACLELTLPAVLTIQSGINTPRYPTLSNALRAKTQKLEIIDSHTFKSTPQRECITLVRYPEKGSKGIFLEGTTKEKAKKLLQILHKESILQKG